MSKIVNLTNQLEDDVEKANIFVHGDENASYPTKDGARVPSIRNLQKKADINISAAEEAARVSMEGAKIAQEASQASQLNAGIYPDIESGIASTESGEVFLVARTGGLDSYKNNNGAAEIISKDITSVNRVIEIANLQQETKNNSTQNYIGEDLYQVLDSEGRATWIQVDAEGLPGDVALKAIAQRQGVSHEEAPDQHELMFAVTSKEGVVTHLALGEDGRFPDFVINDFSRRIGIKKYPNDIGFVGSSTIWLMHGLISQYFDGFNLALLGDSGARFDSIAVRGGFPASLKFESAEISAGRNRIIASWEVDKGMDRFDVTLDNGIDGEISYLDSGYHFTPATPQDQASILTDEDISFSTKIGLFDFVFINSGKNNMGSRQGIDEEIFRKTLELVKFYESKGIEYVVLDHFANHGSSEEIKKNVLECNRLLKYRFGRRFLSIFDMIKSDEMWAFTGLVKTPEDIEALNNDELPPSFQMNNSHLNDAANQYIVLQMFNKYQEMTK